MKEYCFSKKDIRRSVMSEGRGYNVYKKGSLMLNEWDNQDTAYADSKDDLDDALTNDSRTGDAVIPQSNTTNDGVKGTTEIGITGKTSSDIARQIDDKNRDPNIQQLAKNNQVNYAVHKEVNSIRMTKSELNEILRK